MTPAFPLNQSIESESPAQLTFEQDGWAWVSQSGDENRTYWRAFLEEGSRTWARNLRALAGVARVDDRIWPVVVHDPAAVNSYPCSLYSHYIRYPLAELKCLPSVVQQTAGKLGLNATGLGLAIVGLERTVQWSSWMLSTNLHSEHLATDAQRMTELLVRRYPEHIILVRNVNEFQDPTLPKSLQERGYELWTSRQIYFFDGRNDHFTGKSTVKRDAKALRALQNYTIAEHDSLTNEDAPRIAELYRLLYLEKHSHLNPQYTSRFVESALANRLLEFRGLRHVSGRLDGVFACFSRGQVTSTPFIGYDTSLPTELGLYRHLVSMLLEQVSRKKLLLNYSSGAGEFKRRRGGKPVLEYNAVYTRHLSPVRRLVLSQFGKLVNQLGRSVLENHGL